jgi:uncharacterized iron-regulated protein
MRSCCSWFLVILALACVPSAICAAAEDSIPLQALDLDAALTMDSVVTQLAVKRVVFVGETHDRYDHHLNQLEIIRRLHQLDSNLVIGVEYFQQHFQPQVDDYIAQRITEDQFLRAIDYYRTWGYDYRLYAPIFRFAREQRIPVLALNVPGSLASTVAKVGFAGLSAQQRASLPREIQPADDAYKARLRSAFEGHQSAKPGAFDHFVEAQLVWDESMAASAADYLNANQGRRMVILAGSGHVAFGSGIPSRLERRTHASYAIVLSSGENIEPQIADFVLLSKEQQLPPAGVLGASLKEESGECRIHSLDPAGAAEKAGIKRGDALVDVDGQPVKTTGDVRLALWNKKPGERVVIRVRRGRRLGTNGTREFEVELAAPGKGGANT